MHSFIYSSHSMPSTVLDALQSYSSGDKLYTWQEENKGLQDRKWKGASRQRPQLSRNLRRWGSHVAIWRKSVCRRNCECKCLRQQGAWCTHRTVQGPGLVFSQGKVAEEKRSRRVFTIVIRAGQGESEDKSQVRIRNNVGQWIPIKEWLELGS